MNYLTELHAYSESSFGDGYLNDDVLFNKYIECGYKTVVLVYKIDFDDDQSVYEGKIDRIFESHAATAEKYKDELNILLGAEFRTHDNDFIIYAPEKKDLYDLYNYRGKWITDYLESRESENILIVQAHPAKVGGRIIESHNVDGFEVFCGDERFDCNNAFTEKYCEKYQTRGILLTSGSGYFSEDSKPCGGIVTEYEIKTSEELAATIRKGNFKLLGSKLSPSRRYKTELHCHSSEISGCSSVNVKDVVDKYVEYGYTTLVLTNHLDSYGDDESEFRNEVREMFEVCEKAKQYAGDRLNVIPGVEINIQREDHLIIGVTEEFLSEQFKFSRKKVADFKKTVNDAGMLLICAHPMRFAHNIFDYRDVDGIEVFNGHPEHNSNNDLVAFEYASKRELGIILTSGTDHHDHHHKPNAGILTDYPITTGDELVEVLKSSNYSLIKNGYGCSL